MNTADSLKLLRSYADHGDEAAFRKLVEQYIDLVYSAALRRVSGDASLAQDVTQAVFTDLARKAQSLRDVEMLGGWLYRHTGFTASNMVRSEHRRQAREQEAAQMNTTNDSPDILWQQLAPMLDDTIDALEPSDRQAVLLRFFERRDFRAIGDTLGISSDAAQKRVSRAVDKLRALLTERGVTLSVVILSSLLLGKAVVAAPAGLAVNVAKIALTSTAAGAGAGLTLAKLAKSFAFKLALGGTVVAVALLLWRQHNVSAVNGATLPSLPGASANHAAPSPATSPTNNQSPAKPAVSAADNMDTSSNGLLLSIVAADSGQPIPDMQMDYWLWINGHVNHKMPLMATRFGVCRVPVPDGTTELLLVSEKDGFAETLLEWHPDRGEQIPNQYTLKVARSVPIGGTVVNPDGQPVAGAEVGFNCRADVASQTRPQSDDFSWPFWVTATTDAQGHWQINRIGKAAVRHLDGGASHPDFVRASLDSTSPDPIQKQLLNGTYIFTLGRAVVVHGTVKDTNGNPVPGADVLVGHVSNVNSRSSKSQSDGSFSIAGCTPGQTVLTARAKGFAATTIKVNLADNSGPYDVTLQPGKTLKLRVVDEYGNPVPHATVYYDAYATHMYDPKDPEKYTVTQVDFTKKTDQQGRLTWNDAPAGELTFEVAADGFMRMNGTVIPADGIEHAITLQRGLTIAGTVVDATTGRPIPRFRIITGWPDIDPINHTTNAAWSTLSDFWLSFEGGQYQYTYNSLVLGGVKDPAFMFKFEADGYAPFVSGVVPASQGFARLDVALTPAQSTEVTVLWTNNQPVIQADVGLVSANSRLRLIPGGFSRQNIQSGGTLLLTDDQGHFQLPPDDTITKVVVANPQGYAEATPSQLAANPVIDLLPWGQLEGICTSNGQAFAGCTLSIQYGKDADDYKTIACNPEFHVQTDSQGHFLFNQVPTGSHIVTFLVYFPDGGWSDVPLQVVTINPGETTTVTLDRTNYIPQYRKMPM